MNEISVQVLAGFGIRARRVIKEKSQYICFTDKGNKYIRRSFDSAERIMFQHEAKERLHDAGFSSTDRFEMTASKQGEPFVAFDGGLYTMTAHAVLREPDFTDNDIFRLALDTAAAFHNAARRLRFAGHVFYADHSTGAPSADVFRKHFSQLTTMKKKLSSQKKLSDFDVLVLKNYDFYIGLIETAAEMLEKFNFDTLDLAARRAHHLCHGALKEGNMPIYTVGSHDRIQISNFSRAAVGSTLSDVATLIARYMKNMPDKPLPLNDIIALYTAKCPLGTDELQVLYPLLIYPHKFIRICNQYYSKKRTWTPNALTNRMEATIKNKEAIFDYAAALKKI